MPDRNHRAKIDEISLSLIYIKIHNIFQSLSHHPTVTTVLSYKIDGFYSMKNELPIRDNGPGQRKHEIKTIEDEMASR